MEECHKMLTDQINWANPEGDQVRIDVNRPLPVGGPLGHVTIQTQFFFNKDLEYLRYGNKESRPALSISKMNAARYPDVGLELLVPEQIWIDEVCTYEISVAYGISHSWFNQQKFYIERHDSPSHRREVRKHMRILSVIRIKAYSRYGYDYLSEILLRRADYQEYTIAEKDFKNMYPIDFEDLNLLLLQGHFDHLPDFDKRMLSTAINLTKPGWDAKGFEFKHDYTIIESPRAVVFPVNNNERKIMRFNKIYKFSDGTLTRILEALDYRGDRKRDRSTRTWNALLVDVFAILTTDFFRERNDLFISFIRTSKLGDSDVHTLEDPTLILQILSRTFFLRLNLPDHRLVLTASRVKIKMEIPRFSGVYFITACSYSTDTSNDLVKAQKSQAQDGEIPQVDDQRLDLADVLKEAQDHISKDIRDEIAASKHKSDLDSSSTQVDDDDD
ncbi:hypothetical protein Tco_0556289, partial [Tanacetum coccineum]